MEAAVKAKLFGPGSPLEMKEEEIGYAGGGAPHHRGVRHQVFAQGPQTLVDLFRFPEERGFSERDFLVYEGRRYTFAQVQAEAAALGHVLVHELGLVHGDRVAIVSRNCPEYIIALMAAVSVGCVAVPMNSWWKTDELRYGLEHSGSAVVLCDRDRYAAMLPALDDLACVRQVLLLEDPREAKKGSPQLPLHSKAGLFAGVVAKGKGKNMPAFRGDKDDAAIIMYTSGTTGHPKGVVLTHRGVAHALTSAAAASALDKTVAALKAGQDPTKAAAATAATESGSRQPAVLLSVPLFHATGLHAIFLISLLVGRKIVLMYKWDPERALQLVEQEKVTTFTGVPTMVLEMMNCEAFSRYDTSTLESVGGGGAPPPPSMVRDVAKMFKKAQPSQGYGMTETNAVVCITAAEEYKQRPRSCGRAVPGCIVEVWHDEKEEALPVGEAGRVMIKGANLMKEYWRDPEATAAAITASGFLDTGDIGKLDEEGYLYLLDRKKDIILRGGENISCATVEAAVYNNEHVSEAAVFGLPHPTLGEEVAVAILPKPGQTARVTLAAIRDTCSNLANYEQPAHVFLWDEQLPRGATGKILKREIRTAVAARLAAAAPASKL